MTANRSTTRRRTGLSPGRTAAWLARTLALALFCAPLTGLAADLPPADEIQALGALFPQGFASPLAYPVSLSLDHADSDGQLNPIRRDYVALAVQVGALSVTPDTTKSPWWRFERGAAPLIDAGHGALSVGERTIVARSNQREWTEGGKPRFAETVTYVVKKNPRLTMIPADQFGPFSVRLVLARDPASGRWTATMGTALLSADEGGAITRALDPAIADANAKLAAAITEARGRAFAAIEQSLKDQGVLERDPADPAVLLARKAGIAYFTKFNSFDSTTLSDLMRYCARQGPARRGPWRLASEADLKAVIGGPSGNALIDTPDRRLWGALGTPVKIVGWYVVVPTSNVSTDNGSKRFSTYDLPARLTDPQVVRYRLDIDGAMTPGGGGWVGFGHTVRAKMLDAPLEVDGRDDMRVVCSAPLKK